MQIPNHLPALISIVLATYNGEKFLGQQLESIINQSYKTIEVVVVDDASTDGTMAILNSYAAQYSFFKVYSNKQNIGYIKNFEKGILLAKGEFVALCDQDDIWYLNKLSTLINNIGEAEIIYSNSELIDDNGIQIGKKMSDIRRQIGYDNCLMYTIGNWAPGHAMLIRRQLINRAMPFPIEVSHDLWLGFVTTFNGAIKYLPTPLVYYRQHTSNVFGAVKPVVGQRKKNKKLNRQQEVERLRQRMAILYQKCPDDLLPQKNVFKNLLTSYQSFSLKNNWLRMAIFFKYRNEILAYKNKNAFGKYLFCVKMFVMLK